MYFLNPIYMGILFICSCIHVPWIFESECIWAATWQNQQNGCVPSEDSDQPGHPPSLIRVFAVRMKKHWVLSYALSAQRRLWSDWADAQADLSLRWAHSHFVGFVTRRLILKTPDLKVLKIELNERYMLFNRFLSWHPRHPFFPCHLSQHYENSSHVSCRVKKKNAMVKVDETGAKILSILIEKFAFFDFDM